VRLAERVELSCLVFLGRSAAAVPPFGRPSALRSGAPVLVRLLKVSIVLLR
jgi:hypothetical protein